MLLLSSDYSSYSPTSFKDKLKLSICCFTTPIRHHILHPDYDSDPGHNTTKTTPDLAKKIILKSRTYAGGSSSGGDPAAGTGDDTDLMISDTIKRVIL
ncbi:hypothetical protein LINGRAPRIM_LOCUS3242 [Linum grandiflorum]